MRMNYPTSQEILKLATEQTAMKNADIAEKYGISERAFRSYLSGQTSPKFDDVIGIVSMLNLNIIDLIQAVQASKNLSFAD